METASTASQPAATTELAAELAELVRLVLTANRQHATLYLHHWNPDVLRRMYGRGELAALEPQTREESPGAYLIGRVKLAGVGVRLLTDDLPAGAPELTREQVADAFQPGG